MTRRTSTFLSLRVARPCVTGTNEFDHSFFVSVWEKAEGR
jgi:hypothetical protein